MKRSRRRWSTEETEKLKQMRYRLLKELKIRPQYPDVVGDRRMLRFLRGHKHNVDKACEMYGKFLRWRDDHGVDRIRDDILFGGMKSILDFPGAKKILELVPQIVIAPDALDRQGHPVSFEEFSFVPEEVIRLVTHEEYAKFMMYIMEYKTLVLEQMSSEKELEAQETSSNGSTSVEPFGVILGVTSIRDCRDVGIHHINTAGKTVLRWMLEIAADNYPETIHRSYMVNVPWIFNTVWFIIKAFLDPNTVSKNSILSADFLPQLEQHIPLSSIPRKIGGGYEGSYDLFKFDLSEEGPFSVRKPRQVTLQQEHVTEKVARFARKDGFASEKLKTATYQLDYEKEDSQNVEAGLGSRPASERSSSGSGRFEELDSAGEVVVLNTQSSTSRLSRRREFGGYRFSSVGGREVAGSSLLAPAGSGAEQIHQFSNANEFFGLQPTPQGKKFCGDVSCTIQ